MEKKKKNMTLIRQKMELTFSLRRREVVEGQPMVSEVQESWPALFSSEEISEEFRRITSKDLFGTFNASLDKLYRSKKCAFDQEMEDILDKLEQTSEIVSHRKTAALTGLPIFFQKECSDSDILEPILQGVSVAILTILQDDEVSMCVRDQTVVLEGDIVLHDIPDLAIAVAYLFGLLYAMNINYPKQMRYTFKAIFKLGGSQSSQRTKTKTHL